MTGVQGAPPPALSDSEEQVTHPAVPGVPSWMLDPHPRYVGACELAAWQLRLEHRVSGEVRRVQYRCRSWRHPGRCATHRALADCRRLASALARHEAKRVCFLVLTLPRRGTRRGAYETLWRRWQSLRQWLQRTYGKFPFAATVEQHRDGWPHLNVVLVGTDELLAVVDRGGEYSRWLLPAAARSGWGWRVSAERARDASRVAAYLVKVARLAGEATKASQLPLAAPRGLRRLRASRGFLPPRVKGNEWTGTLETHGMLQQEGQ